MTIPVIVPEDLDGDRDGDLEQRAWSEDEKKEILRRARETIAHDDDLEGQRTWSDDERREILRRARDYIAQGEDGKQEILRRDGDLDEQRTWSVDERREILRRARDNIARRDATGLTRKVKEDARQSPERRRRSEGSADDVDDTTRALPDPRRTAWPQTEPPIRPRRLDASLDDLVAAQVETAFAQQHDYILQVMATALAEWVCKERRRYRRHLRSEVREIQIELGNLQSTLAELREVMGLERGKTLDLPNPLTRRRSNLN